MYEIPMLHAVDACESLMVGIVPSSQLPADHGRVSWRKISFIRFQTNPHPTPSTHSHTHFDRPSLHIAIIDIMSSSSSSSAVLERLTENSVALQSLTDSHAAVAITLHFATLAYRTGIKCVAITDEQVQSEKGEIKMSLILPSALCCHV